LNQNNKVMKCLAIIGLAAVAAIAAWQFYLFVAFKNADGAIDVQGGTLHLWVAIGSAVLVCVGGFFLFAKVLRYDKRNEMHIASPAQLRSLVGFRKDVL